MRLYMFCDFNGTNKENFVWIQNMLPFAFVVKKNTFVLLEIYLRMFSEKNIFNYLYFLRINDNVAVFILVVK